MTETFRHKALYGYTGMGKTTVMKAYARVFLQHKQQVIVFPGTGDTTFPKGVKYYWSADELEAALNDPENFGAFVMIDEGASLYGEVTRKLHPTIHGLFMRGRHKGYTVFIATQYPTSIPPAARLNCGERFLFGIPDEAAADLIWKDCGRIMYEGKTLKDCILQLQPHEYFHYIHPGMIAKCVTRK